MLIAIIGAASVAAADTDLSPPASALVAAVRDAMQQVRSRQAASPPPRDDAERLVRLGERDQAGRRVVMAWDMSKIPASEQDAAMRKVSAMVDAGDREDQAELLKLLPPEGWFLRSRYGNAAATAAFEIVQHAGETMQKRFLPVIEPLVKRGEVDGESYGMMFDRVRISDGQPQRYGTQFRCDGGKWRPYPLEDPEHVEARRAELGFGWSYAQEKAQFQRMPPCPQTRSPPPPGMVLD